MNSKIKKTLKLIIYIVIIFILINIFLVNNTYAANTNTNTNGGLKTSVGQTVFKLLYGTAFTIAAGFFTIKFTLDGIQYMIAVSATEKAANKNKMSWDFFLGVLTFFALFLVSRAVGI